MLCDYGCGNAAEFELKNGKSCCSKSYQSCPVNRKKNSNGLKLANSEGRKGYTWNPKSAWSKGKTLTPNDQVFKEGSTYSTEFIKARILSQNLIDYECEKCNNDGWWQDETMVLDLDHINGKSRDNRLENLRFLCPNCHSQTPTYKGRNNTGKIKVTDEELLEALSSTKSIRQALIKVDLAPKGGNYERANRLLRG